MELSPETIARLKERAGNAERRTDTEEMMAGSSGFDELLGAQRADLAAQSPEVHRGVRDYLEGMNSPLSGMIANGMLGDGGQAKGLFGALGSLLGGKGMFAMGPGGMIALGGKHEPTAAPPPASEADVAAAEAALGFPLPAELRQFYLEVADGGVGPEDGLYSLNELVAKWREFTAEPIGPRGQKWPANLLPIHGQDWDVTSIDRESGGLIRWDVEEIDYGGWAKSFVEEAESLDAWLAKWLARPSAEERARRRAERQRTEPQQLTDEDWEAWAAESPENREYLRRMGMFSMTPEERAAAGLPEHGWEQKVWEGIDLAKIRPPLPGYAERKRGG